jgi:hypothetical protein
MVFGKQLMASLDEEARHGTPIRLTDKPAHSTPAAKMMEKQIRVQSR